MPRRLSSSCREFRGQHVDFFDGSLSEEVREVLMGHLDVCPACAQYDVAIRRSLIALQALPEIEPSSDFRARLAARLALEGASIEPRRPPTMRWGMAGAIIAASAALLFVAMPRRPGSGAGKPIAAQVVVYQPGTPGQSPEQKPRKETSRTSRASSVARLEALPGRELMQREIPSSTFPSVRLQTVTYIGQ